MIAHAKTAAALICSALIFGLASAPAVAGAKWTPQRCNAAYNKYLAKHHISSSTRDQKKIKKAVKYVKMLNKKHHCGFRV